MGGTNPAVEQLQEENRLLRLRLAESESSLRETEEASDELKLSDDRFRKIFDHSNDGIFLADPVKDEILDVNAKACRMLGYSREELISVPMSVIHPHDLTWWLPPRRVS